MMEAQDSTGEQRRAQDIHIETATKECMTLYITSLACPRMAELGMMFGFAIVKLQTGTKLSWLPESAAAYL